jgi:hypothetical protein
MSLSSSIVEIAVQGAWKPCAINNLVDADQRFASHDVMQLRV